MPAQGTVNFLLKTVSVALQGVWKGSMTDWIGTAQATLTMHADASNSLVYRYDGTPASYGWYDVLEGGRITVKSVEPGGAVAFSFLSPNNIGHEGPYCWAGDFQGSLTTDQSGNAVVSGMYELWGWSEDCFDPGRRGTFSWVRDAIR